LYRIASPVAGRRNGPAAPAARVIDMTKTPEKQCPSPCKGGCMKRCALMVAMCLFTTYAQAWGLPCAVDSLQKAQAAVAKDDSKHLLVFYTKRHYLKTSLQDFLATYPQ
jgi:hypothetical protein